MKIRRIIQKDIEKHLFAAKVIIIYGARQVGKTTLIKEIQNTRIEKSIYLNCDEPDIRQSLTNITSTAIKEIIGDKKLVFIDEAQRVKNIGITLKLFTDTFPDIQVVATGSSSFELSNEIAEPLTGRKYEFYLYPFSIEELAQIYSNLEIKRILDRRMIFGMYPEVVAKSDEAERTLKELARSYLYKDILEYQEIKNSEVLEKLLQALALQIGNEVSYNELAGIVGVDKKTVDKYIQILEKAFVIFRLRPYSGNIRNELKKLRKIYFYDTGIRNALINNLNPLNLRQDVGSLWENFLISERIKLNNNHNLNKNIYFWRTHQQQEIDYIEEEGGRLSGFEFKWGKQTIRKPNLFLNTYAGSAVESVNRDSFLEFIMNKEIMGK